MKAVAVVALIRARILVFPSLVMTTLASIAIIAMLVAFGWAVSRREARTADRAELFPNEWSGAHG